MSARIDKQALGSNLMRILGLHFGHDASIALIDDGVVKSCYEVERLRGVKHAIGITSKELRLFLDDHQLHPTMVDSVAVTTSQGIEYLFDDPELFSFSYVTNDADSNHLTTWSMDQSRHLKNGQRRLESIVHKLFSSVSGSGHPYARRVKGAFDIESGSTGYLGSFEDYIDIKPRNRSAGLSSELFQYSADKQELAHGFQYPIHVNLFGHEKLGYVYSHHFAHAAYAAFTPVVHNNVLIISHDGSLPFSTYRSGGFYVYSDGVLSFLAPHYLSLGKFYEVASGFIGFSEESGPGKMMGLAPYGRNLIEDNDGIGNYWDILADQECHDDQPQESKIYRDVVYLQCENIIERACSNGQISRLTAGINVNRQPMDPRCLAVAANVQFLCEKTIVDAVRLGYSHVLENDYISNLDSVALTGGFALNCPANKMIASECSLNELIVNPAVHDAGLSIGAALHLSNLLNPAKTKIYSPFSALNSNAYLGKSRLDNLTEQSLLELLDRICDSHMYNIVTTDIVHHAATLLAENKVIATFGNRSEIGPRALCSRSILCLASEPDNWKRVNQIKGRELWRPFAPVCTNDVVCEYFELDCSIESYKYMLLTCSVKKPSLIPAVTHVDNTARLQILSEQDNPLVYNIIRELGLRCAYNVLLNTSFNGPGQPIIEDLVSAISFLSQAEDLNGLLVGDKYLIKKK